MDLNLLFEKLEALLKKSISFSGFLAARASVKEINSNEFEIELSGIHNSGGYNIKAYYRIFLNDYYTFSFKSKYCHPRAFSYKYENIIKNFEVSENLSFDSNSNILKFITVFLDKNNQVFEAKFKIAEKQYFIHPNYIDIQQNEPHVHIGNPNSPYKVDMRSGIIYNKTTPTLIKMNKEQFIQLRKEVSNRGCKTPEYNY